MEESIQLYISTFQFVIMYNDDIPGSRYRTHRCQGGLQVWVSPLGSLSGICLCLSTVYPRVCTDWRVWSWSETWTWTWSPVWRTYCPVWSSDSLHAPSTQHQLLGTFHQTSSA